METEYIKETLSEFMRRVVDESVSLEDKLRFLSPADNERPFKRPIILENGVRIWGYCSIHPDAKIGKNTIIGAFTNITGNIEIGDYTRMQGFNFIPQGVKIGNRVFIGPGVIFTNVKYPTVRYGDYSWERVYETTVVEDGANIGAGAIVCPGVTIGACSMIGAGSIVTQNVTPGWLVKGNPARHIKQYTDIDKDLNYKPLDGTDHGF